MDNSQCIRLISLYRESKCLWDPNDTNYTNRGVREDAWRQISRQMNNIPTTELKKKMKSLSGGYRRERFREKQSRITGSGAEDTYKSKWFAYDEFGFMADKNDPGRTRDTLPQDTSVNTQTQNKDSTEFEPQSSQAGSEKQSTSSAENSINRKRKTDTPIDMAIKELKASKETKEQVEDEFDLFCKSLAIQLKKMPLNRALICQERLQSVMTEERLLQMTSLSEVHSPSVSDLSSLQNKHYYPVEIKQEVHSQIVLPSSTQE